MEEVLSQLGFVFNKCLTSTETEIVDIDRREAGR